MTVGILAIQGGFEAHKKIVESIGYRTVYVKKSQDMSKLDALILPGGESTTHNYFLEKYGLRKAIQDFCKEKKPVLGTCAGSILASELDLLEFDVIRNAYGSQKFSFETELSIPKLDIKSFRGIFIRAPQFKNIRSDIEILCTHENFPVLLRKNNIIVASFHPELTTDPRLHRIFLDPRFISRNL